jgi:hypothetical protein
MKQLMSGVCLLLAAGLVRADAPTGKPVAVPFELLTTKHITVQVKLNGKGPYRLLFDTGAPTMLLSNRAARESGVLDKDARKPPLALFGARGQFPIQTFEIGELKVQNLQAVVMDHPLVEVMARKFGPIDGIVGFPFFARYRMTLDYQQKEMRLTPSGYEPVDLVQRLEKTLSGVKQGARVIAPAAQWGLVVDKDVKDAEAGVTVREVLAGSAAAEGGLKPGDRLMTVDGRWTDSVADCYEAARQVPPGTAAVVVVERGGKKLEFTIKPRTGF